MKLTKIMPFDEMEDSLVALLFNIKTVFGPTEVLSTIRKRSWIKDYLRKYYAKCLDQMEEEYYNYISENSNA